MILSDLQNKYRYINLHPLFGKAFTFLEKENLNQLPEGRLEIDGVDLFAIISKPGTSAEEIPKLEAHKKYIDIHYIGRHCCHHLHILIVIWIILYVKHSSRQVLQMGQMMVQVQVRILVHDIQSS